MARTKEPLTISEIMEEIQKLPLPSQIELLKQLQQTVSDEVAKAKENVQAFEKLNGNGKQ